MDPHLRRSIPARGASGRGRHRGRAGRSHGDAGRPRCRCAEPHRVLGCGLPRLSLERDRHAGDRARQPGSAFIPPHGAHQRGDLRCHDRDLGCQVRLQPAPPARRRSQPEHGHRHPQQPLLSR
jgi:hypothetical protein